MTDPPPVDPIGREAMFPSMTDTQLLAWVAMVNAQWQLLPAALAELADRKVPYTTIARATGLPRSTAHSLVQRRRKTASASAASSTARTDTGTMSG